MAAPFVDPDARERTPAPGRIPSGGHRGTLRPERAGRARPAGAPGEAGTIDRPGSNAGFQLVDESVADRKPCTLDRAEAAALPLSTITAWETLFDALRLGPFSGKNVEAYAEPLTPRVEIVTIGEPPGMDLLPLESTSITWHWEPMFTRPLSQKTDATQREVENRAADLIDEGRIRTFEGLTSENRARARTPEIGPSHRKGGRHWLLGALWNHNASRTGSWAHYGTITRPEPAPGCVMEP